MRVGFVVRLLVLSAAATMPASIKAAAAAVPGAGVGWFGLPAKTHRRDGHVSREQQSEDKLRAAAAGGAQKLDNVILRVLAEVTERTARRERLAALAEAIRLFALKEANRWDQQSDTEKTLGVLLAAQNAANWGFGGKWKRLTILAETFLNPVAVRVLVELEKLSDAAPVVSARGTEGHMSRLPGERPTDTVDTVPAQPRGNSRGWFGWREDPDPPPHLLGSSESDAVSRRASQQGRSVQRKCECPHDKIAGDGVPIGLAARRKLTFLVEHVLERVEGAQSPSSRPTYLEARHARAYPFTQWSL